MRNFKQILSFIVLIFFQLIFGVHADERPACKDLWHKLGIQERVFQSVSSSVNLAEKIQSDKKRFSQFYQGIRRSECQKDWTVLVYMQGRNDLSAYALWDLYEMEARFEGGTRHTGSSEKLDVVVQVELQEKEKSAYRLALYEGKTIFDPALTKESFATKSILGIESPILKVLPVSNETTESKKLDDFLDWGVQAFPSKHVMLVVWGHGQGWLYREKLNNKNLNKTGALALNFETGSFLTTGNIRKSATRASRVHHASKPFDIYLADACYMQRKKRA